MNTRQSLLCFALTAAIIMVSPSVVLAQDTNDRDNHRQLAERLLVLMEVDKQSDIMLEQMKMMQQQQLEQEKAQMLLNEEEQGLIAQYEMAMDKVFDMMSKDLSWTNLKDQYIDVYTAHFNPDDMSQLIKFFESPIGKKFLSESQSMMPELMQIGYNTYTRNQLYYQEAFAEIMQNADVPEEGEKTTDEAVE